MPAAISLSEQITISTLGTRKVAANAGSTALSIFCWLFDPRDEKSSAKASGASVSVRYSGLAFHLDHLIDGNHSGCQLEPLGQLSGSIGEFTAKTAMRSGARLANSAFDRPRCSN